MAKFLHSFVSRGSIILCDYTVPGVPFQSVPGGTLIQVVSKAKAENQPRQTLPQGQQTQHYLVDGDLVFMVLTDSSVSRDLATGYLEQLKDQFSRTWGKKALKAGPKQLDKQYEIKLKELMAQAEASPGSFSKVDKVQQKIAETKAAAQNTVMKTVGRGQKIDDLQKNTEDLANSAVAFERLATEVKHNEIWKNMRIKIFVFGGFIALGIVLFFSICGGLRCVGV